MSSINEILQRLINYRTLNNILHQYTKRRINDNRKFCSIYNDSSMKRTKRINTVDNKINHNENDICETAMVTKTEQNFVEVLQPKDKEIKRSKINLKVLRNENDKSLDTIKLKDFEGKKEIVEISHTDNKNVTRKKIRAIVDLKMMKEELKQLEDPPVTPWEKEISSSRLPFEFFDTPCEQLAQHLLGKVLVRRLENGTILKGRIVETEGYLGAVDKASHSYQNKVTPRNIPMYMSPGTIYIYMTYGMYYCFNISSQESDGYVLIKAVEPLLGLDYMELLRNMHVKENKKEKEIVKNVKQIKTTDLCNNSFKICTAFVIDEDEFNQKYIYNCNNLWIEHDSCIKSITIVTVPPVHIESLSEKQPIKLSRYYILGNPNVSEYNRDNEANTYTI
ncbi:DNA-3-methyladenine glycosylase-like isoform X2 [Vespa velutina]|uniref:DNA-3-methyladenine glycosylase-like isoform X2 n=1 Tax=Vespa velutina TaxID=202808 RepID=UPI001FB37846|nr:DNA-3-methyladenine glycosylase-like isoform X2 [Vespa velutina]